MDRISLNGRTVPRENHLAPQNRNQNPRINPPQIRQREKRGHDQQIGPPFQENYSDEDGEIAKEVEENQINLMGVNEHVTIFLTQEEKESFFLTQNDLEDEESDDYKQGF